MKQPPVHAGHCRERRAQRVPGLRQSPIPRTLRVGVLLPRSGVQAGIGQDCQRGVQIAAGVLASSACPSFRS